MDFFVARFALAEETALGVDAAGVPAARAPGKTFVSICADAKIKTFYINLAYVINLAPSIMRSTFLTIQILYQSHRCNTLTARVALIAGRVLNLRICTSRSGHRIP